MSEHVIETVTFRLRDGVSPDHFLEVARQATAFMSTQPGFLRRRLSCEDDGTWTEHVEWACMADAKAAAAEIGNDARARAVLAAIDGPSVAIRHAQLKVAVG